LTAQELEAIESALAAAPVQGDRYSAAHQKMIQR
jgi:hypothetical protein